MEIHMSFAQKRDYYLEGLVKTTGKVIEGVAKCVVLWLMPAGTEPQDETPATDLVKGIGHLGKHSGRTKRGTCHHGATFDAGRDGCQGAEHSERLPGSKLFLLRETVDEVVCQPEGIEAVLLGGL